MAIDGQEAFRRAASIMLAVSPTIIASRRHHPLNYFNGNGLGLATDYTGGAGHVGGPIDILEVVV